MPLTKKVSLKKALINTAFSGNISLISLLIIIQYVSFLLKYKYFLRNVSIPIFHPLKLTPQWLEEVSDESINNLLTLVIWKCVYDHEIYCFKGFFRSQRALSSLDKFLNTPLLKGTVSLMSRDPSIDTVRLTTVQCFV